jgi:ABC-type branched-subunit amino acid transport system ATPase component
VLEARNSTKRFGILLAVDDLNLQIRTAEGFGFLGAKPRLQSASTNRIVGMPQATSDEMLLDAQPLESVERGMIGIFLTISSSGPI